MRRRVAMAVVGLALPLGSIAGMAVEPAPAVAGVPAT